MAERRMFSNSIIGSDAFTELPLISQMLYIHLNFASDDDGFCDCPRQVMNRLKAKNSHMLQLVNKKFILIFEGSPVICIKHWRIHNQIRKDRYKPTKYQNLLGQLYYDENKSYSQNSGEGHYPCLPMLATTGCQNDNHTGDDPATQDRIGKDRVGKESIRKDNNPICCSTSYQERGVGETNEPEEENGLTDRQEETVYPDCGEDAVKEIQHKNDLQFYRDRIAWGQKHNLPEMVEAYKKQMVADGWADFAI